MSYVIIGGYGMQAQAIGQYLLEFTRDQITIVDTAPENMQGFHRNHQYRVSQEIDADFLENVTTKHTVISCVPTQYNGDICNSIAQQGHNYIDLGGQLVHTEEVIGEWNRWSPDAVCIPDCGVAPGLVSTAIGNYLRTQDVQDVKIYCGGIPKYPSLYEPHRYGVTFNPEGVIKEYTGVVQTIEKGKVVHHAALDGLEEIFVDGLGYLEAVHMSGSLSKTPELLETRHDQSYCYKTLRWPGHWKWVKENVLTQPDPDEIIRKVIPKITRDYLVLLAVVDGTLLWHKVWEYDPATQLTGMQQATGYTVGAIATMITDSCFQNGINWMHDVDFTELWSRVDNG